MFQANEKPKVDSKAADEYRVNNEYLYEDNDIQAILSSRLQQAYEVSPNNFIVSAHKIHILAAVDDIVDNQLCVRLEQEQRNYGHQGQRIALIPCNLGNYHWIGIILEFRSDGQIQRAEFLDSLNTGGGFPESLQRQVIAIYPDWILKKKDLLKQEDNTSCGAYTVENLLLSTQNPTVLTPPVPHETQPETTLVIHVPIPNRQTPQEQIRRQHLESLANYDPNFYRGFYDRQRHNRPTVVDIYQQLGWLNNDVRFSRSQLKRIFEIVNHIEQIEDKEIQDKLWGIFTVKNPAPEDTRTFLMSIREQLKIVATDLNKKNVITNQTYFKELIKLVLGVDWIVDTPLVIENANFRLEYNELVAITANKNVNVSVGKRNLAIIQRQIAEDEDIAKKLQQQFDDEVLTIALNAELSKLHLFNPKNPELLSKKIIDNESAIEIDFSYSTFEKILIVLKGLESNNKKYKFNFSDNDWLGVNELSQITKELSKFIFIELSLTDTKLGDEGIAVLLEFFRVQTSKNYLQLNELNLSGCNFTNIGFIQVCNYFSKNPGCLHHLDLQEVIECNVHSVIALRKLIERNQTLKSLWVSNLLMSEEQGDSIITSLKKNQSLEDFITWDSACLYHWEQIDILTWRNKTHQFKKNAFQHTLSVVEKASHFPVLYLVQMPDGNFNIVNQEIYILIHSSNPKFYGKKLLRDDAELLCHLIDKFIYKIKHYEKYERDLILGYKSSEQAFIMQFNQYLKNTMMVAQAINYVWPGMITLDHISNWKILSIESGPDSNNQIIGEDVLSPFRNLIDYLEEQVTRTGHNFGDDLSDDSDSDEDSKLKDASNHEKRIKLIRKIKKLKEEKIPNFQHISYYTSPKKKGLVDKLKHMQERVNSLIARKITLDPETWVSEIQSIVISFDKKKLKRAKLPAASPAQVASMTSFNAALEQYQSGNMSEKDFQEHLKIADQQFVIPQFRGINYLIDRWNHDSRRFHRKLDETNQPMYAESVLKTLPFCFYSQLDEKNNPQSSQNQQMLKKEAVIQSRFLQGLNDSGFVVAELPDHRTKLTSTEPGTQKNYLFNSVCDYFQTRFSNGINLHLQGLRQLQKFHSEFWRRYTNFSAPFLNSNALPNAYNYSIASGDRPLHALYYALGDKSYYRYPLLPRYHEDGTPEYQHVGKLYASLHRPSEFLTRQINKTSLMNKMGFLQLREGAAGVAPEKESSFLVFNEGNKIFLDWVMKLPSFNRYHPIYESKYGLTPELFALFKWLFQWSYETDRAILQRGSTVEQKNDKDHTKKAVSKKKKKSDKNNIRKVALELLTEWLCSYWEILFLHLAAEEANCSGLALAYFDWNGRLSFEANPGNLHRQSSETTAEANFRKELRMKIAQKLLNDNAQGRIEFDKKTCPGFSIASDISVSKAMNSPGIRNEFSVRDPRDYDRQQRTLLFQRNMFSSASRQLFDPQMVLDNDNITCSSNRAIAFYKLARYEEALTEFNNLLAISPENPSFLVYRGHTFYHLDLFEQSLTDYDQALKIEPNHPTIHSSRGFSLLHLNRLGDALATFNRALELKPEDARTIEGRKSTLAQIEKGHKTNTPKMK